MPATTRNTTKYMVAAKYKPSGDDCAFLRLSAEMRNNIYAFVFGAEESTVIEDDIFEEVGYETQLDDPVLRTNLKVWAQMERREHPLLRTNKQIRTEALEMYLHLRTYKFPIRWGDRFGISPSQVRWMEFIGRERLLKFQSIEVEVYLKFNGHLPPNHHTFNLPRPDLDIRHYRTWTDILAIGVVGALREEGFEHEQIVFVPPVLSDKAWKMFEGGKEDDRLWDVINRSRALAVANEKAELEKKEAEAKQKRLDAERKQVELREEVKKLETRTQTRAVKRQTEVLKLKQAKPAALRE